jgi:hypothetical protein
LVLGSKFADDHVDHPATRLIARAILALAGALIYDSADRALRRAAASSLRESLKNLLRSA